MLTPGKAAIVYHDGSGRGRATALLAPVRNHLEAAGWHVGHEEKTRYAGHAQDELAPSLAGQVDLIVVIGGDGMLREVSAGLKKASSRTPLGLVPTGNANVVARELGIPLEPWEAMGVLTTGSVRRLDAGTVRTHPGATATANADPAAHADAEVPADATAPADAADPADATAPTNPAAAAPLFFLAMVEVGFGARIVHSTHHLRNGLLKPLYRLWGAPVYGAAALGALVSPGEVPFDIDTDGTPSPVKATGAVIANTRCYAKSWSLSPDARMDDGWLDLVLRSRTGPGILLRSYAAAARSRPQPVGVSRHERGRRFVLSSEKPMTVQVDGDPVPPTDWLEVQVMPGAVGLVSP